MRPSSPWVNSPAFLKQDEEYWPQQNTSAELKSDDGEVKISWVGNVVINAGALPDPKRFSSWTCYKRAVTWMLRFIQNTRRPDDKRVFSPLSVAELEDAENLVVKVSQQSAYPDELASLKAKKPLPVRSHIVSLSPWLDENGMLRAGGRLRNAPVSNYARHPPILDRAS